MAIFHNAVPLIDVTELEIDMLLIFPSLDRTFELAEQCEDGAWGGDVVQYHQDGTTELIGWEWYDDDDLLGLRMLYMQPALSVN